MSEFWKVGLHQRLIELSCQGPLQVHGKVVIAQLLLIFLASYPQHEKSTETIY